MSALLLTAEQIAALAEIAGKFISLITEIQTAGAAEADQAWRDTVSEFQAAQAAWTEAQVKAGTLASTGTLSSDSAGIPPVSSANPPTETDNAPGAVAKAERVARAWST